MAVLTIQTNTENAKVEIIASSDADFSDWMMACEFLLQKTAQLSNAGYERAIELLVKGSMTYRTVYTQ